MEFTKEQINIINCNDPIIVVNALAGCSKTTTILEWCRKRPHLKILYIVFSKAMADEAKRSFKDLRNVEVRTTHSLAYKSFGVKYKHKLTTSYRAIDCMRDLQLNRDYDTANTILRLFNKFLASNSDNIVEFVENYFENKKFKNIKRIKSYAKLCEELWNKSLDINSDVQVTHDFYLKLYQMQHIDLGKFYDVMITEEAQDSSMVVFDMFECSKSCKHRIAIGDKHQSIFYFRGCVDLMNIISSKYKDTTTNLELNGSFRIGQQCADMCNLFLGTFKNENTSMLGYNPSQRVFSGRNLNFDEVTERFNVITRTNAVILAHAIEASQRGKWLYFEGGIKSYPFQFYKELYWFRATGETYNNDLKKFESWSDLTQYAEEAEDIELLSGINFVNIYSKKFDPLPKAIDKVFEYAVDKRENANFCYCTAHKSKGLTLLEPTLIENDFPKVNDWLKIINDVKENDYNINSLIDVYAQIEQEVNLLYVAITRSKGILYLNDDLSAFFCI